MLLHVLRGSKKQAYINTQIWFCILNVLFMSYGNLRADFEYEIKFVFLLTLLLKVLTKVSLKGFTLGI